MHQTQYTFRLFLTAERQAHIPDDTAEHAYIESQDLLHNILIEDICSGFEVNYQNIFNKNTLSFAFISLRKNIKMNILQPLPKNTP